jgi:hypothetical protein
MPIGRNYFGVEFQVMKHNRAETAAAVGTVVLATRIAPSFLWN